MEYAGEGRHLRHRHRQLPRHHPRPHGAHEDQAIVCNIGHFDNEIDVASIEQYQWGEIKPQVDHVIFPTAAASSCSPRVVVNLGCATGHHARKTP